MKHSFRIVIPTVACGLVALDVLIGSFLWKCSTYNSVRKTIEAGDEDAAIRQVQRLSKKRLFNPDWTIQSGLPDWRWVHELDLRLFGCPTCRRIGCPLLQYAVRHGQPRLVTTLLASGASINLNGDQGAQVLTSAVGGGDTNIIATLIAQGANPNAKSFFGSPIHGAAGFGKQPEAIEALLNAGAKVNATDGRGWTPLDWATVYRNTNAARFLMARGAVAGTNRLQPLPGTDAVSRATGTRR